MHTAALKYIKEEISQKSKKELENLCLQLAKFSKENKEYLTYLIFESQDEEGFIKGVKIEIDQMFDDLGNVSVHFAKKGIRKILARVKKYIRYSKKKESEVELLLYFCKVLIDHVPHLHRNSVISGIFERQTKMIEKGISALHEDLQFDYTEKLKAIL